jgi:hypothetical protein
MLRSPLIRRCIEASKSLGNGAQPVRTVDSSPFAPDRVYDEGSTLIPTRRIYPSSIHLLSPRCFLYGPPPTAPKAAASPPDRTLVPKPRWQAWETGSFPHIGLAVDIGASARESSSGTAVRLLSPFLTFESTGCTSVSEVLLPY